MIFGSNCPLFVGSFLWTYSLFSSHRFDFCCGEAELGCSHDVNVSIGAKDWWHPTTRHNSDFSSLHVVNTQNSFVYQWEGVTSIIFRNFHNTNKASKQDFSHVTRKYIAHTKNWPNKVKYLFFRQLQFSQFKLWKLPSNCFCKVRLQ